MRITVFTSNQPRHVSLIEALADIADEVFAIQECNTVFPGQSEDFFRKSDVMRDYFSRVMSAEEQVFGKPRFPGRGVRQLPIRMGDLNKLDLSSFGAAMDADRFIVFGASYIKGPLVELLVSRGAINIHMGVSPFYRGSSTNFWAMYDHRPKYVGATIHQLSTGLDSGPILFHAFPKSQRVDPFVHGMRCVRAAHVAAVESIRSGRIDKITPVPQDKTLQLRYSKNAQFTDAVASEYLDRLPTPADMATALSGEPLSGLVNPVFVD